MEAVQQNNSNGSDQTVAIPTTITASHISQIAQVLFMYVLMYTHFHDVYTYTCCVIEHLFKYKTFHVMIIMYKDVSGWESSGCGSAAQRSVPGSRCDSVSAVIGYPVSTSTSTGNVQTHHTVILNYLIFKTSECIYIRLKSMTYFHSS